jgi:hypothetical protein
MKKLKDKYADQDEEERTIRMELLGVSNNLIFFFLVLPITPFIHNYDSQIKHLRTREKKAKRNLQAKMYQTHLKEKIKLKKNKIWHLSKMVFHKI